MKIHFRSIDGIGLVGILERPKKQTRACIILCHGATADKEEGGVFTYLSNQIVRAGFATFRFDFRGHGESGGGSRNMTVKGETKDLEAAYRLMVSKRFKSFGILGASFGGGASTYFTAKHQKAVKALIYWNSALEYVRLRKRWLSQQKESNLKAQGLIKKPGVVFMRSKRRNITVEYGKNLITELGRINPWKEIKKIKVPILFIHSDKDSHVPYHEAVRFSKINKSELKTIYGSEHGFHTPKDQAAATKAAVSFLRENMPK